MGRLRAAGPDLADRARRDRPRYRRAERVTPYAMSDGSAAAEDEAHALNEGAAAIWCARDHWSAAELADWLAERGHPRAVAPMLAQGFLAQLAAAGLVEQEAP